MLHYCHGQCNLQVSHGNKYLHLQSLHRCWQMTVKFPCLTGNVKKIRKTLQNEKMDLNKNTNKVHMIDKI